MPYNTDPSGMSIPDLTTDPEYQRGAYRAAGIMATSILPSWLTQVSPYRVDPEGQGHWQAPGGLLGMYGGIGAGVPALLNYGIGRVGLRDVIPEIPAAPGSNEALRQYQETRDMAFRTIPHMAPETNSEKFLQDLTFSGAAGALPGAGTVTSLAPGGPIGRFATSLALQPVGKGGGAALNVGIEATKGVLEQQETEEALRDLGLDPGQVREQVNAYNSTMAQQPATPAAPTAPAVAPTMLPTPPIPPDLTQPDQGATVSHPQQGAAGNVPFPTVFVDKEALTPQFGESGQSELTWRQALLLGLGVGGAAVGGMKYAGKPLDRGWKAVTGRWDEVDTAGNRAKHNANLDAIDSGQVTQGQPGRHARGEAPLPGKAGRVGTNLATEAWDSNRKLEALIEGTTPKSQKLLRDQLAADLGTTNGAALSSRINEQMATGVNRATGNVLPRVKEMLQRADELPPQKLSLVDEALHVGHELDTRGIKRDKFIKAKRQYTDEQIRQDYRDIQTAELERKYATAMADPDVKAIVDQAHLIAKTNFSEGVAQGRFSAKEFADFQAQRPRFKPPTDAEGRVLLDSFKRDVDLPGWQTPNSRAFDAITEHYGKLYEHYAHNTFTNRLAEHVETWQAADPLRARIFNKAGPKDDSGRTISVYRNGVEHRYHVDNTSVHRALTSNVARTNMTMNAFDSFRRSMQSGTTGVSASIIAQRPFPIISLLRNIPQIAVDRAPGTVFGMLDRVLQSLTGGRIGNRTALDPTIYLGSFNEAIRGVGAVTARNMSDALRNPSNYFTQMFHALHGKPWTDWASMRLRELYEKSNAAARRAEGVGGSGAGGIYDARSWNVNANRTTGFNPMADQVPGLYRPNGMEIPWTRVALPGTKGLTSTYINFRTLLREISQEISDGANSYYWKQNRHLSPERRAFETRRVIGDPSVTGANPWAQRAGQSVAYLNPSVQDMVRTMRNLRDNPVAYAMGTASTLTVLAAASVLSAMLGGPDHLRVLEREMTANERASNVAIFNPNESADSYTIFSLPQKFRVFYPAIMEMVAYGIGAFQARPGEDLYNRIIHSLADIFSQHVSVSTRDATLAGVYSNTDFAQVPQVAQVVAGMGGIKVNPFGSAIIQSAVEGGPILDRIFVPQNKETQVPNRGESSSYISKDDNGWVQRFLSNTMGFAGKSIHEAFMTGWDRFNVDHSVADMFSGLIPQAGQSWRDHAGFGNSIWGNNIRLNHRNPMADSVESTLARMRDFPKLSDMQAEGYTRPGGLMSEIKGQPKVSEDPTIRQMVTITNRYATLIENRYKTRINDFKKQQDDVDRNYHLTPEMKRSMHNQLTGKLNDLYEEVDLQLDEMHDWLSQIAGKRVHVKTFDTSKGLEQFHD